MIKEQVIVEVEKREAAPKAEPVKVKKEKPVAVERVESSSSDEAPKEEKAGKTRKDVDRCYGFQMSLESRVSSSSSCSLTWLSVGEEGEEAEARGASSSSHQDWCRPRGGEDWVGLSPFAAVTGFIARALKALLETKLL